MSQGKVNQGFALLEECVLLMAQALECSFFEAYIETGENILDGNKVRVVDGLPETETVSVLEGKYHSFTGLDLTSDEMRKVTQLVLLSGLKKEPVQPNHQLTPDALGMLIGYLAGQLLAEKKEKTITLHDLTVGTGNLLFTVLLYLKEENFNVKSAGVEVDELLLSIASVTSGLIKEEVTFYLQDSLQNLLLQPADLTISDLPVGFYPDDVRATDFLVAVEHEHTYAHHLLMEQAMNYAAPDGFGIFMLPENFLSSGQSESLKKWFREKVYLQAVLELPKTLFQSQHSRKVILIVQNRSEKSQQAKEVLLADIPSLKDPQAIRSFFEKFKAWQVNNI